MIAACALACAAAPQGPADARELLAWHQAQATAEAAAPADAAVWRDRLWVYVRSGAEAQAWDAAARLEALAPGDPDAARYRIRLSAWDPARWRQGAGDAALWLAAHAARPAAEIEEVRALREHLAAHVAERDGARARQRNRALVPAILALLLLAAAVPFLRDRA